MKRKRIDISEDNPSKIQEPEKKRPKGMGFISSIKSLWNVAFGQKEEKECDPAGFQLPHELQHHFMQYLSVQDLGTIAQVCKEAKDVSEDDALWRSIALKEGYSSDFQQYRGSVKNFVRDCKKVRQVYPQFIIDLVGGEGALAALPTLDCKEVEFFKPTHRHFLEKENFLPICFLKEKIWKGMGLVKSQGQFYEQPFIAFVTKDEDAKPVTLVLLKCLKQGYLSKKIYLFKFYQDSVCSWKRQASANDAILNIKQYIAQDDATLKQMISDGRSLLEIVDKADLPEFTQPWLHLSSPAIYYLLPTQLALCRVLGLATEDLTAGYLITGFSFAFTGIMEALHCHYLNERENSRQEKNRFSL